MTDDHSSPNDPVRPDVGFRPDYELIEPCDLGVELQLPLAESKKECRVRNSLLIALSLAWFVGAWLSYPRNRNIYPAWRRYYNEALSYGRVMRATEMLEESGIIEHQRMKPHPKGEFQSRMRLSTGVKPPSALCSIRALRQLPFETVRLRDGHKNLCPYTDCEFAAEIRSDILEHNEVIASINIKLPEHLCFKDKFGFYRLPSTILNPCRTRNYRTFNLDWSRGG